MSGNDVRVPASAESTPPAARLNRMVAVLFAMFGAAILAAAWRLPPGIGNLPGPGFFPAVLGLLILGFAAALGFERTHRSVAVDEAEPPATGWKLALAAVLLLVAFIWSWGAVMFMVRTPLLVLLLMRLSGATWRNTLVAAVVFPFLLYAIFQLGLRVDLN